MKRILKKEGAVVGLADGFYMLMIKQYTKQKV